MPLTKAKKIATYGKYNGLPSIIDADKFYLGSLPVNTDLRAFSKNSWAENISALNKSGVQRCCAFLIFQIL